jgi:hypothetical protein
VYNNSFNHTLKTTPFRAIYGYDPDFHIDVEGDVTGRDPAALPDRIKKLQELRDLLKNPMGQSTRKTEEIL